MEYTVSITSQGQICIPVQIQRKLGLAKASKAVLSVKAGKMVVEPVVDLLKLRGSLQTKKPTLTSKEMDEVFAKFLARNVGK